MLFQCVTKSGESFVEVINIGRKLPFATLYTVVNAAHNVLECLLIGIVFFYFDLRRSGFDDIGAFKGLYIRLLRFTGSASGTRHLEQRNIKRRSPGAILCRRVCGWSNAMARVLKDCLTTQFCRNATAKGVIKAFAQGGDLSSRATITKAE